MQNKKEYRNGNYTIVTVDPCYDNSLPFKIVGEEKCLLETRLIAVFMDKSKTTLQIYKIKELVKLIKDEAYSKGFKDGSKVNDI